VKTLYLIIKHHKKTSYSIEKGDFWLSKLCATSICWRV